MHFVLLVQFSYGCYFPAQNELSERDFCVTVITFMINMQLNGIWESRGIHSPKYFSNLSGDMVELYVNLVLHLSVYMLPW